MTQGMQEAGQKGKKPNRIIQRIKERLIPLVLLGMAIIIVESLITYHLLPLPAVVENILILPALFIAFFLHLGSFGALNDKDWTHRALIGCIPNLFGFFGILGYFAYIAGISMITVRSWRLGNVGVTCMCMSGILSAPLLVLYLQQTQEHKLGGSR